MGQRWITGLTSRHLYIALGSTVVLLVVIAAVTIRTEDTDSCEHATVARVLSPDGAWQADVNESTCLFGLGVGAVVAEVHLLSTRDPARSADLLGVDTGGNADERPKLAWVAPDILQVTVPNRSFLKILALRLDGVQVKVRFEPDDPAERAVWLREHDLPPDADRNYGGP